MLVYRCLFVGLSRLRLGLSLSKALSLPGHVSGFHCSIRRLVAEPAMTLQTELMLAHAATEI